MIPRGCMRMSMSIFRPNDTENCRHHGRGGYQSSDPVYGLNGFLVYSLLYGKRSLQTTISWDTMHTIRSFGNQFDAKFIIKSRFHEEAYPFGLIDF